MSGRNKQVRTPGHGVNSPRYIRREAAMVEAFAQNLGVSIRASLTDGARPFDRRRQEVIAMFTDFGYPVARHRERRRANEVIEMLMEKGD